MTEPFGDPFRRVVTGHDETGKAVVLFDSENPNTIVRPVTGIVNRLFWVSESTPADISGPADRSEENGVVAPPQGGTSFRIIDFPSMTDGQIAALPAGHESKKFGSDRSASRYWPATHPLMHRQRSLDYGIVLAGEIEMRLDDSSVHLKTGDVFVQQGTNHAWINQSGKPCRIAFVFIDAVDPFASS